MLRFMRRSSRWVMWIVILGVGAVFVLYLGIGGGPGSAPAGPDVVVAVGDRSFDARHVLRVRQQQEAELRRNLGDSFDAEAASDFLDQNAASVLLRQALLAEAGERMGLTVSDPEIRAFLRRLPGATDEEGRLDRIVLTNYAEREFGSLRAFQEALRDEILAAKAARRIAEGATVTEAEAREALRQERTEVRLALVDLDASATAAAEEEVPAEAVDALLAEDPERVRAAYEARDDEFDRPEEVRARHILVQIPEAAPEEEVEAARARLDEIRARIEGGADFADVAMEVSEDQGSKERGGDLGFFPRGRMVAPFEEVAFSLEPGVLSEPVRSPFGLHLIRVEEKRPAQVVPFEEARREVARDLVAEDRVRRTARERAEALAQAVREGATLVDAARAREIPIERPDAFRWRPDGYVPGVGPAPEVMAAAFALTEESPSDPTLHEVGEGRIVLIQLLERNEPAPEDLEAAVAQRRETMLQERRNRLESTWLSALRDQLRESGELVFDLEPLRG
jgi:peptidyl-prolyl cis-trans isomerase D